jgi:CRISPR-associated endonuclease/helicase Cas3
MTASLPKSREEALFQTVRDVHGFDLEPMPGPDELEELPRYHKLAAPGNDPLCLILRELDAGGKLLWVCNTVGRVMHAADRAKDFAPLVYHSRFRYEDRVERHKQVVGAFTPERQGPALAICSQVAEMSLDLKGCTLLVTDLAPVPALIQRLGRLNRQARPGDPTKPFVVIEIEPDAYSPYVDRHRQPDPPRWPEATRSWLARLQLDGITERDLVEAWEHAGEDVPLPSESSWLDGGPTTTVNELREASPGITVLMEEDRPRLKANPKVLARLLLPMPPPPRSLGWQAWPREKGIPIAPAGSIKYDPERGAGWKA